MAAKFKLSGPIFNEERSQEALKAVIGAVMKVRGKQLEGQVQANTPVGADRGQGHKAGTLKNSIKVRTTATKSRITVTVEASAVNDSGFPYGAAVEKDTGFVGQVLEQQAQDIVETIREATIDYVNETNTGKAQAAPGAATPGAFPSGE